jgi:N-acyl homoserine lactone hydrolase
LPFNLQTTVDFEGIYDVASDGSMILLPTPGHTPGSVSMLIRSEGWAPILLVGDLTYEAALLETGGIPGTGDAATLRASYVNVRRLKEKLPDLVIVPSHDFAAAEAIGRATQDFLGASAEKNSGFGRRRP